MPIYEYRCLNCNSRFELLRPMSRANQEVLCPACSSHAKRVPSIFASFSRSDDGTFASIAGAANPCSTCAAASCASCNLTPSGIQQN